MNRTSQLIKVISRPLNHAAFVPWHAPASGPCFGTGVPNRAAPTAQYQTNNSPTAHRADEDHAIKCPFVPFSSAWRAIECVIKHHNTVVCDLGGICCRRIDLLHARDAIKVCNLLCAVHPYKYVRQASHWLHIHPLGMISRTPYSWQWLCFVYGKHPEQPPTRPSISSTDPNLVGACFLMRADVPLAMAAWTHTWKQPHSLRVVAVRAKIRTDKQLITHEFQVQRVAAIVESVLFDVTELGSHIRRGPHVGGHVHARHGGIVVCLCPKRCENAWGWRRDRDWRLINYSDKANNIIESQGNNILSRKAMWWASSSRKLFVCTWG